MAESKQDRILSLLNQLVKDKLDDHERLDVLWKIVVEGDEEKKIIPVLETLRSHERSIGNVIKLSWAVLIAFIGAIVTGFFTG